MAVAGPFIFKAGIAFLLGKIAGSLLSKDKRPSIDNTKPALASRGDYIPILIGTRKLSPVILWVGDRTTTTEGHAGGKGVTGGGGSQLVYRESSWHALCVGPARKLKRITENDKEIWNSLDVGAQYERGITAESHPSGSTITVSGHGSFRIFWGEQDQPVNTLLGEPDRIGYDSRHRFICYIQWIQKRLGGAPAWGRVEYEVEARPYKVGDLYSYTGPYEGRTGLPERLTQSTGWMQNGIGVLSGPEDILAAEDGTPGIFKLQGNVVPFGGATLIDIEGNSALADGRYDVDSASYNAAEQLRVPTGTYIQITGGSADFDDWTLGTGVTSIVADPTVALPPGAVPFGFTDNDIYKVNLQNPYTGIRSIEWDVTGVATDVRLSPGVNHIRFWVRGFNTGNFDQLRVQLYAYDHPSLSDNTHEVIFDSEPSGFPNVTRDNGGDGSIENVGQSTPGGGPSQDWWQVDFTYRSGTGTSPSDENWKRRIKIRFVDNNTSAFYLYANDAQSSPSNIREDALLADDDGTLITGITTVETVQEVVGSEWARGTLSFLSLGSGHDGANGAHIIDQLMFETFPHGLGLDRSKWDLDALEEVGVAVGIDGEGLRCHVLVEDGSTLEGVIANICLDLGLQMSWDPVLGKGTFKLVRDPGVDPVPTIPREALNAPLPEITTILDAGVPEKKIYMFADRDLNYRPAPANSTDDDGKSSREERQNAQKEDLFIVTDLEAANQVASRREQYDLSPPTTYDLSVNRAARRLVPGTPLFVEDIEERLRLMDVGPIENLSSQIKIKAITDVSNTPPLPTQD